MSLTTLHIPHISVVQKLIIKDSKRDEGIFIVPFGKLVVQAHIPVKGGQRDDTSAFTKDIDWTDTR